MKKGIVLVGIVFVALIVLLVSTVEDVKPEQKAAASSICLATGTSLMYVQDVKFEAGYSLKAKCSNGKSFSLSDTDVKLLMAMMSLYEATKDNTKN